MEKKNYEKDTFLARWLNGELNEAELKSFKESADYQTFDAIAGMSKDLKPPVLRKEKVWQAIEEETKTTTAKVTPIRRRLWLYAAAASVALLIISGYLFQAQNQFQTISTPLASQQNFTLPDGSTVLLNAESSITFSESNFLGDRILQLNGEAYFTVKKGSRFLVETLNGKVQVLGTSFNVFSRKNKLAVTCYTGLVGVHFGNESTMEEIKPDNKIIAEKQKIISRIALKDRLSPEWADGNSRFYLANMSEVIEELERQFDVAITYPTEVNEIKDYNGGFPHNDLETALDIVFSSLAYQFEIKDKKVRVFK